MIFKLVIRNGMSEAISPSFDVLDTCLQNLLDLGVNLQTQPVGEVDHSHHVSYGATDLVLNSRNIFPTFFRTVLNDSTVYSIIAQLLKYFGWTWVGIIASDDDSGEKETALLRSSLTKMEICVAFVVVAGLRTYRNGDSVIKRDIRTIQKSTAQVIVICGTFSEMILHYFSEVRFVISNKTLILNPSWSTNLLIIQKYPEIFNLSLSFTTHSLWTPNMTSFFNSINTLKYPEDKLLEHLWVISFNCSAGDKQRNTMYEQIYNVSLHNCSGMESISNDHHFSYLENTPQIYFAVYSLAGALHDMIVHLGGQSPDLQALKSKHKLYKYVRKLNHKTKDGKITSFTKNGDFQTHLIIFNNVLVNSHLKLYSVGNVKPSQALQITRISYIKWKTYQNQIPRSQCSETCSPGNRRVPSSMIHPCCHECLPCSEGEISNKSDTDNCVKCLHHQWPDEKKTRCLPKLEEFLSITADMISQFFLLAPVLFCIVTAVVLGILILHQRTPLVKANNKVLSFVLLVCIMLGFLSVFLFLVRPVDLTCLLRQISFGISFTIAVSSVLGKTIMVYIAFKATKPGSTWKKWLGNKPSYYVVIGCSSVQVLICLVWLTISPPFQELDTHSYKDKIIVQCNEGSVIGFYSVLGYMGLLAAVSFVTAFITRTLPDSFNEAKYITFSMLVFCSVWIAMIPAYLSTKGKYMVTVEIFAILASNMGLLGCIFFPKCYIIICRSQMNTKAYMMSKGKCNGPF
ncbi:vomeronasal type-2 receptor 26-like [Gastrophryne carolinensis]